jgi:hypothetical protein
MITPELVEKQRLQREYAQSIIEWQGVVRFGVWPNLKKAIEVTETMRHEMTEGRYQEIAENDDLAQAILADSNIDLIFEKAQQLLELLEQVDRGSDGVMFGIDLDRVSPGSEP